MAGSGRLSGITAWKLSNYEQGTMISIYFQRGARNCTLRAAPAHRQKQGRTGPQAPFTTVSACKPHPEPHRPTDPTRSHTNRLHPEPHQPADPRRATPSC
eukprot:363451-Chlamydomonas_euryale.AAC.6